MIKKLEECLGAKASYEKFSYIDLNAVEVASSGLHALLNTAEVVRDTW